MAVSASRTTVHFHPKDGIDGDFVIRYLESHADDIQHYRVEQLFTVDNNNNNNDNDNKTNNHYLIALDRLLLTKHTVLHLQSLELPRNGLVCSPTLANMVRRQSETLLRLDLSHNPLGKGSGVVGGLQDGDFLEVLISSRLVVLNLEFCKLGSGSSGATAIASLLRRNSTIRELYLGHNDIGTKGIGTMAADIASNTTLEVLDISHNKLKARGASVLAGALQQAEGSNNKLRILDVTCNRIGTTGMQAFARLLSMNKTIEGFYVGTNNLGWEGAAMLAAVLKVNYKLRDLRLPDNNIEDDGAILIATEGLTENDTRSTALERLDLSWNQVGEDGAMALAETLQENAKLHHLDLTGNQISCQGAAALAEALASNFSLQELILTKNQLGNEGAFSLALALGKPTCGIKHINWNDNPIAEEGLKALARVPQLRNNQKLWLGDTLKALAKGKISAVNFMNRVTGDEELLLLCDILVDNNPLVRSLWLSGRIATSRGILTLIDRALPSPSNIERIYLKDFSNIGDEIATSLGMVLRRNMTLGVISITECDMTETGAAALAAGLKHNSTLRRLQLDRNRIGDVGMEHLAGVLPHSTLISLAACRNNISDRTMAKLENLKSLQELHLNWNRITNTGALDFCKFLENNKGRCELVYVSLRENAISRVGGETIQKFLPDNAVVEF